MKLSIVTTMYKSEAYINEFYERACRAARELVGDDYEIIMVNDGSPDNSLGVAVCLSDKVDKLVVVDLSRNFGHHKALMTGLDHANGDKVFLLDSDLEELPEWLPDFDKKLIDTGSDVVFGVQDARRGKIFERITGGVFYRLFRLMTGVAQPDNIVTARIMTRRYVESLLLHREREINIGGLWMITGYAQTYEIVRKQSSSPTTYTVTQKVKHLVNAVTSFSSLPLVFTFYTGLTISMSALFYIVFLSLRYFTYSAPPDGYTSIIASIWLFSGLLIFFLGVQGIYIAKIFSEVKQRPYTIVRQVYGGTKRLEG